MKLPLSALPEGSKTPFHFEVDWEQLPTRAEGLRFVGPIALEGHAWRVKESAGSRERAESVILEGTIRAIWQSVCDRCLKETAVPLELLLYASFVPQGCATVVSESGGDDDLPGEALDDASRYDYSGDALDLTDMLQDEILLNLPSRVLCKDKCRGLCPICGCDRNETICACQTQADEAEDSRFAALRHLNFDDEEV